MSRIVNILDDEIIITMKGRVDLEHYCPKCESNEFHSCIGTDCALCGEEIDEERFPKTKFDCTKEEKEYLLAKVAYVNSNITRVGLSAFNYANQVEVNVRFDKIWKERKC